MYPDCGAVDFWVSIIQQSKLETDTNHKVVYLLHRRHTCFRIIRVFLLDDRRALLCDVGCLVWPDLLVYLAVEPNQ